MKSLFFAFLLLASPAMAGFTVPALKNPVNDYANVLTHSGKEAVAEQIVMLKKDTQAQLGVLIVNTLDGDNLEEASMRVAKTWGLGDKANSDGILLFVVVKDRKMRIEVGQGLESTVTDAQSKHILGSMKTALRSGNYDLAIKTAVNSISETIKMGKADIQHANPASTPTEESSNTMLWVLLGLGAAGFLGFLIYRSVQEQRERERQYEKEMEKYREEKKRHATYVESMNKQGKTAHKPAPVKPRRSDDSSSSSSRRKSSGDTYVGIYSSNNSYSSSSSSSSSSSDSGWSSSDWGGGGGDFSGGGSSDSW